MKTVLVTGATGYLGRHLMVALRQQQTQTFALVRNPSPEFGPYILGSPLESEGWLNQAQGVDTIVHAAGMVHHTRKDSEEMTRFNVESVLQMIRAAHALKARVIFVSSSGTVGCFRHGDVVADEDAPYAIEVAGRWPYYASKIEAERSARRLASQLGVELTIVRPPMLLGPGDVAGRSTSNVARVLEDRLPFIPPGGVHFSDVRDVAAAIARLSVKSSWRAAYHLPGTALPLNQFFKLVGDVAGKKVNRPAIASAVVRGVASLSSRVPRILTRALPDPVVLEMSTVHWGLSSLWSQQELNYVPRSGWQTISDTVNWLRENRRQ